MEQIISSIIVGVLALVGVIVTNASSNKTVEQKIVTSQEVMKTEVTNLRKEVEKHNNFASRIPVVEEQIKVINHRINDLEKSNNSRA